MKNTISLALLLLFAFQGFGQTQVLTRHKPTTTSPAPVTYSAPTQVIKPPTVESSSDAESRRAAALAKVQGRTTLPANTSAKGLSPATYSTDEEPTPVTYSTAPNPATTVTVNGDRVARSVRKGSGQVGNDIFTPVSELHYVQFAVYCKNTPVDKAPSIDGLYLLWHPTSVCPGGEQGASYIVKGYTTPEEAKVAVKEYMAKGIECWYNPTLSGAEVEIIGVR